jgi:integrase/recombinase XerC
MLITDAINEYLAALRQAGRSPSTVRQYRWHLTRLAGNLNAAGAANLADITRTHLRHYGADLLDAYAPATVRVAVIAARSWLTWCHAEQYLTADLHRALRQPKVPLRQQRTLTRQEITALLNHCDADPCPRATRDASIISTLVDAGLRRSELCRLTMRDIDITTGRLRVTRKGGDQSYAYIGPAALARLHRWLAVRPHDAPTDHLYLSVGGATPNRPITPEGLRSILRRLGAAAGIPDISPHAFRRSFATLRLENGVPTRVVQALGGWKRIDMVERYSQALDLSRMAAQSTVMDQIDRPLAIQLPLFGASESER